MFNMLTFVANDELASERVRKRARNGKTIPTLRSRSGPEPRAQRPRKRAASRHARRAEDRTRELGTARADEARKPDDLSFANLQGRIGDAGRADVLHRQKHRRVSADTC